MSKNLEQRVEDVLAIACEPLPHGYDQMPASWERRMKGAIAQVFLLGMGVGWDKCVASMDNTFRDLTGTTKRPDRQSPDDFHTKTGGQFRPAGPGEPAMPELRAFRENGTEVQPGDEITMAGIGEPFTFRAALQASNASGTDGLITAEKASRNYPNMYAGPFGLTVRAVPDVNEPAWTDNPSGIGRDIRGPGGFWARITPDGGWLIIDSSDGETVTSGIADGQKAARQAVADWERDHGLVPDPSDQLDKPSPTPETWAAAYDPVSGEYRGDLEPSDQSESAQRNLRAILADLDNLDAGNPDAERDLYAELEHTVRDALTPVRGGTEALAAEADRIARTMAPPVPGVTRNSGCVVYSVLEAAITGVWYVAAMRESDGERVTWRAEAASDGTLVYTAGNYHTRGQGSADEALADLAVRAGVFSALDRLSSGIATREAYRESHAKVLDELSGIYGVGKARVHAGLLEAAALGYARISWHSGSRRNDYGIRYDRYRCTFSWTRES